MKKTWAFLIAKTDYLNAMLCQPEKVFNEAGTPLITMDASYFDPMLPKYAPQCFIVYLRPPLKNTKITA